MSSIADILNKPVITRAELNTLKAIQEEENRKIAIDRAVADMRRKICATAQSSDKKSLFHPFTCNMDPSANDPYYRTACDIIDGLKQIFPDVDIELKSQKCLRTGKELNQGIYIDWS
jgi:hypothetical protein